MQRRSKTSEARALVAPEATSPNKSANTEPQLQEAASPQWLWPGCLQRYAASC
jgi:hypothetical protein